MTHTSPHDDLPQRPYRLIASGIFDGERLLGPGYADIAKGRISAIGPVEDAPDAPAIETIKVDGTLSPGLIDLQANGGGGALLNETPTPETLAIIAQAHLRCGTTGFLATLISDSDPVTSIAIHAFRNAAMDPACRNIIGMHFEGPWLNPARAGAHRIDDLRDPEEPFIETLITLSRDMPDHRVLTTLAPERVPPALLSRLTKANILLSAGHSEADQAVLDNAIAAGLKSVTHLFNAMEIGTARDPRLGALAMSDERLMYGLIADGVHVGDAFLTLALKAPGALQRAMLVSDAMAPAGDESCGSFILQARRIFCDGVRCIDEEGNLAGAAVPLAAQIRILINAKGWSAEDILPLATRNPARFLGIEDRAGHLKPGYPADMVVFDKAWGVSAVFKDGRLIPPSPPLQSDA